MEEKDISPIISIVMVVYNAVQTIEDTIISVISQLQEVAEFVVVDGCSTDGTQQIIEKYISKIAKYKSEPDTGIYDAMNKSLSMCQGQYIYFIGADDILIDNTIINVLPYLTGNRVIYGNVIFKLRNKVYDGYFNMLKIVTRNISHQSIFYPKKVFLKYEFNTNYRIFADYDLNLKLFMDKSFSFEYVPITIALFNDSGSSGSNSPDLVFEKNRNSIIKDHYPYWVFLYRVFRTQLAKLFL